MQSLQGIAVSPGVAFGEALVIDNEGFRIPRRFVSREAVDHEIQRLAAAIGEIAAEIEINRKAVSDELGDQYGAIFAAHLQMLRDPRLRQEIEDLIRQRNYSPEYAVSRAMRRYARVFESLGDAYLAQRSHDLADIEKRLLRNLLGRRRQELSAITSPVIVLAHNLTPSETANLNREFVLGFVTEVGGAGGHTAIVAKALEIPAVVGTGRFMYDVSGGDLVIVDGDEGAVILQADEATLAAYRRRADQQRDLVVKLRELRNLPAETTDGQRIQLDANIEFPHEVHAAVDRGADGIGLYRTEFLYLESQHEPSEEDHVRAYTEVVQAMGSRPVTIRTLDLGADKTPGPIDEEERNPFLGLRSIRLSLRNLPLFRTQLRAVLRVSPPGNVRVMFPLVSTLSELRQAKMVLADVMEDLEEEGLPFDRDLAVGMMVEVPAAVVMLDRFLPEVDFISIGTNDLIQYALAVDRSNKDVATLYNASDPAVLRFLDMAAGAAEKAKVAAQVCGQMSGSAKYTMLLLGLGIRGLSVPPSALAEIKKICRSVSMSQCREVAQHALELDTALDVDNYLRDQLRRVAPELIPY